MLKVYRSISVTGNFVGMLETSGLYILLPNYKDFKNDVCAQNVLGLI